MRLLLGLVLLAVVVLVLFSGWVPWPEESSEYAAWLQALGGLATLIAVLLIASSEERRHRSSERRAIRDRVSLARSLASVSALKLTELLAVADQTSTQKQWSESPALMLNASATAALRMIERIVPTDLDDPSGPGAFYELLSIAMAAEVYTQVVRTTIDKANSEEFTNLFFELLSRAALARAHFASLAA